MPVKKTNEQFIKDAIEKHGGKFNYSKTNYINSNTKVTIICNNHGEFEQNAHNHLGGSGCPKCGKIAMANLQRKTINDFISRAKITHGDRYDYSKFEYISAHTKSTIICKVHGNFLQAPVDHISGDNCSKCSGKFHKNTNMFVEEAITVHGDKYDYSKVNYINSKTKVIIICKKHGEFEQVPSAHILGGDGCRRCAYEKLTFDQTDTKESFIIKARSKHGDLYDYSDVVYKFSNKKVNIICIDHGVFEQKPNCHLLGQGCPLCYNKTEGRLFNLLEKLYPSLQHQYRINWCKNNNDKYLPFDFVIKKYKIIIELDGPQHFKQIHDWKSPEKQQQIDKYKMKCANENSYSVIRLIQEDVFNDTYNWLSELDHNIKKLISEKTIQNIYMCKNNEYDVYNMIQQSNNPLDELQPISVSIINSEEDLNNAFNNMPDITSILNRYESKINLENSSLQIKLERTKEIVLE